MRRCLLSGSLDPALQHFLFTLTKSDLKFKGKLRHYSKGWHGVRQGQDDLHMAMYPTQEVAWETWAKAHEHVHAEPKLIRAWSTFFASSLTAGVGEAIGHGGD